MAGGRTENKKRIFLNHPICCGLLSFLVTTAGTLLLCFLKGCSPMDMLRNVVLSGIGCFGLLFLMAQAEEKNLYGFDNGAHLLRFTLLYALCFLLAGVCAYLPAAGWPFLTVFVLLALFSNALTGICAGGLLLCVSVLLSGCGMEVFVLYFTCGLVGCGLFYRWQAQERLIAPALLSVAFLFVGETACVVIYANESLKWELFLVPFVNVLLNIVLLLLLLKLFSNLVIYKYRNKYMEINDQECALLVEFKAYSKEEYYRAVHTAYFCGRIAAKLNLDAEAAKSGGYYHRIGLLKEKINWENTKELIKPYAFPPAAERLLEEYLEPKRTLVSREAAVLLFSDLVISSILGLLREAPSQKIDYDALIDRIFKREMESTVLEHCEMTMEELTDMKNTFREEKLYYDFLH